MKKEKYEFLECNRMGGVQRLYRFENGYGASVIKNMFSYGGNEGLWELAVIEFEDGDIEKFNIVYTTPVTDDVIGHLTEKEVDVLLAQIDAL